MKFTKEDFINDIDALISHYRSILQMVFLFAIHKISFEDDTFKVDEYNDSELHRKIIEDKKTLDEKVLKIIEMHKLI